MALADFIRKQFIDIIEWTESEAGTLAWRFPMRDMEIRNGSALTVRESQMALFVNEGKAADCFTPGLYKLTTQTLPILTYLKNWDKLFESPFKSDVYFFSTRQQLDQRWGTAQPITVRDAEFGAVRIRAFGNYAYHIASPQIFFSKVSGTVPEFTTAQIQDQLRGLIVQSISAAVASSGVPFIDLAAKQSDLASLMQNQMSEPFAALGLQLDSFTLQSLSLPEELQKMLDQRISMGMVGQDMNRYMQFQTAQAIPLMAQSMGEGGGGGLAGQTMGMGAGLALGQALAQSLTKGLNPGAPSQPNFPNEPNAGMAPAQGAAGSHASAPMAAPGEASAPGERAQPSETENVMALLEKLGDLKTKGILTQEEFDAKKGELLKKLI